MRLILMRHGETTWNAESRLQGQDNSALSERGIEQVRRFRAFLRALNPARVVSSDLGRTRQTAELIGHGDCPSDPRLREWDMGSWTGRTKPELIAAHGALYHAWRAGDLVFWDNRCLLHRATPSDPQYRRVMQRTMVQDDSLVRRLAASSA